MSDEQPYAEDQREAIPQQRDLVVYDFVRYLERLGNVQNDPRIGNLAIARGLRELAHALKRHGNLPLDDLANVLDIPTLSKQSKSKSKQIKQTLPSNIESLDGSGVEQILGEVEYTKAQIAELGARRFGISRSRLTRLSRDRVIAAVRAALSHEKSLGVISEEARRGGEKRSS